MNPLRSRAAANWFYKSRILDWVSDNFNRSVEILFLSASEASWIITTSCFNPLTTASLGAIYISTALNCLYRAYKSARVSCNCCFNSYNQRLLILSYNLSISPSRRTISSRAPSIITLSWSAANCFFSTALRILPRIYWRYEIFWSQVRESSVATVWIAFNIPTESAFKINRSSSWIEGNLKNKLSIDLSTVPIVPLAPLIAW